MKAQEGTERHFGWRHQRYDGTEFDSEVRLNRIDLAGETYIQAIVRDVSEQKHVEEQKQQTLKTLHAFMENSPAVIYIKDKDGTYLDVNRRFLDLFGLKRREDIIGKTDYALLPKEQSDKFRDGDRRVLSGEVLDYELVLELPDRTETFIDHKFALQDEHGEPYAICGAATNITKRKEAEQSLSESKKQYRALADHVADGIMVVQEGKLLFVNDSCVAMFGYETRGALEGIQASMLLSLEDQSRFLRMCRALVDGMVNKETFQAECVSRSGRKFWIEGEYTRITWKGGPAVLGSVRDITEFIVRERAMKEETEQVRDELVKLRSTLKDRYRMGNIIGKSPAMQKVYEQIMKAAASNANVVILGESGTGKELVARAVHEMSVRAGNEFIPVNCGAIPDNLVESEFFGYRKGAFTGADSDKKGYFYSAKGGTLFLDEVGEIGISMQVKLLRAIETGEYIMLGDTVPQKVDVRIVAATSKGLRDMVGKGQMREDFYYRVSVIIISLPPLRNRKEDIPLLSAHFLDAYGHGKKVDVPGRIMEAIYNHSWPGNVRELQNAIQRFFGCRHAGF